MEHVKSLLIKFVMCLAVVWIILGGFYNVTFGHVLTLSIILTVVSYVLGDLYLLPRFENWGATISDFILAVAVIWLYLVNFVDVTLPVLTAAALTSLVLSLGEWFFHKYVADNVLDKARNERRANHPDLQTEFGEEIEPPSKKKRK